MSLRKTLGTKEWSQTAVKKVEWFIIKFASVCYYCSQVCCKRKLIKFCAATKELFFTVELSLTDSCIFLL